MGSVALCEGAEADDLWADPKLEAFEAVLRAAAVAALLESGACTSDQTTRPTVTTRRVRPPIFLPRGQKDGWKVRSRSIVCPSSRWDIDALGGFVARAIPAPFFSILFSLSCPSPHALSMTSFRSTVFLATLGLVAATAIVPPSPAANTYTVYPGT